MTAKHFLWVELVIWYPTCSSKTFGVWLLKKAWEISCQLVRVRQVMKSSDSYVQQSHETWQVCLSDAFLYVFVTRKKTMLYMYMYNVLTSCQGFFVKLLHAQWLLRFLFSPSNHHKTSKIKRGYERIKIIHSMCWRYNLFSS